MKKNGFIATSVLYSLVALLALVMLIVVNNYATIVKLERSDAKDTKEKIYDTSADVIISWKYPDETGLSPDTFPQQGTGYKVSEVECTPYNNGTSRGVWNEGNWKLEVDLNGIDNKTKVRCTVTLEKE